MLKKLTLAAVMALGALALLASASSASKPLELLTKGKPLKGKADVSLAGPAKFTGALGGIEGILDVTAVFQSGSSTGEVIAAAKTNPKPFGLIGHCNIVGVKVAGLPWVIHLEETTGKNPVKRYMVTEPKINNELEGFLCPGELNITGGTVYATPDNAEEIGNVSLSGTVTTTSGNATASGTLNVTGGKAKHYGLG